MGRGKIEIKRIENTSNRQVTYSKRKSGIIKKAKEISVLCDAEVSVVIFGSGSTHRMNDYCSPTTSVPEILGKYQHISGRRLWDAKHENLNNEIERIRKENGDLNIELRHLKGEDIGSLAYQELICKEEVLNNALPAISTRQTELMEEIVKAHQKTGKMLEEENRELAYHAYQGKQEMMMENSGYVVAGGDERDQQHEQIPYGFNFKMHPNVLQEERNVKPFFPNYSN